jgi:hypothetical protein
MRSLTYIQASKQLKTRERTKQEAQEQKIRRKNIIIFFLTYISKAIIIEFKNNDNQNYKEG